MPIEGQQFIITEGSNRSITCTATGYPVPTVVWQNSDGSSLSNNRLLSGSPVNISSTGIGNVTSVSVDLIVIGAMRVDTGMYRCSANNSVSGIVKNIIIAVKCKLRMYVFNACVGSSSPPVYIVCIHTTGYRIYVCTYTYAYIHKFSNHHFIVEL